MNCGEPVIAPGSSDPEHACPVWNRLSAKQPPREAEGDPPGKRGRRGRPIGTEDQTNKEEP